MPLLLILIVYSLYVSCSNFFFYNTVLDVNIEDEILKMNILYVFISTIYLIVVRRKNIFCPELILSVIFYCASYLLSFAEYFEFASYYIFTGRLLLQAISLATLGWTFFIIGSLFAKMRKPNKYKRTLKDSYKAAVKNRNIFVVISIIFFLGVLFFDLSYYLNIYSGKRNVNESSTGLLFFLLASLLIASYYEFLRLNKINIISFFQFVKAIDKKYFVLFLIIIFFLLFLGDRSSTLQILLPFFFLYNIFIHKIRIKLMIAAALCFVFLFVFVGRNRGEALRGKNVEYFKIAELTKDFTAADAAIPVMINYTEKNGYAMGRNMVYQIFSIVPFLQSFMKSMFGIESFEASSIVNSKEILGDNYWSGQGTNVIADLYYSFGVYGIILGMAFAGYIYSILFNKIISHVDINKYQMIAYLVLFGNIIYFCRVEYTYILRSLSFTLLLTYLVSFALKVK